MLDWFSQRYFNPATARSHQPELWTASALLALLILFLDRQTHYSLSVFLPVCCVLISGYASYGLLILIALLCGYVRVISIDGDLSNPYAFFDLLIGTVGYAVLGFMMHRIWAVSRASHHDRANRDIKQRQFVIDLMESRPDPAMMFAPDGSFTWWNNPANEMWGARFFSVHTIRDIIPAAADTFGVDVKGTVAWGVRLPDGRFVDDVPVHVAHHLFMTGPERIVDFSLDTIPDTERRNVVYFDQPRAPDLTDEQITYCLSLCRGEVRYAKELGIPEYNARLIRESLYDLWNLPKGRSSRNPAKIKSYFMLHYKDLLSAA